MIRCRLMIIVQLEGGAVVEDAKPPAPKRPLCRSLPPPTTAPFASPPTSSTSCCRRWSLVGRACPALNDHAGEAATIQIAIHAAHASVRRLMATHGARLSTDVTDAIGEMERALREATAQVGAITTRGLEDARELAEVSDALADCSVRRARMLPFASACEQLPRLVRDIAADVGKPARLIVQGSDVEADRPVLDALKDSLLHLVRNAIDHGVEAAARREALGKPEIATITVKAALHGERLTVTVSDDGAGLDIAAVRRKLDEQGRTAPESDADVARTLFEAGFSTRSVTTNILGVA